MDPASLALWLEASPVGVWMRSSGVAYPAVNLIHLLGLVLLLGSMLLLDLRLLGVGRRLPLVYVSELLTPLAILGLLLLLGSGILLFSADAGPLLDNPLFPLKLACIALGIVNALAFRALWASRLAGWNDSVPRLARIQAGGSLVLWSLAAVFGRLLAYV